jgi:hypothetical protein
MPSGTESLIGQRLSHYRIVERMGAGGMGVQYKAENCVSAALWLSSSSPMNARATSTN